MALNIPRKTESDALLSLLSNCYAWKTCTKFRPRLWNDVNRADKPALFLVLPREKKEDRGDSLQRRVRQYEAWIQLRADAAADPNVPIGDVIDDILDAIDTGFQTLNPDGTQRNVPVGFPQRLLWNQKELVTNAWIEGEVVINPGVVDKQDILIFIPILTRTGNP